MPPCPRAREIALDILLDRQGPEFVDERLDEALRRHEPVPPERRLITELVYGSLRRRGTLDALLKPLLDRPLENVQIELLETLRLGLYQLAYLDHIPAHAAVFETVALAPWLHLERARGFLNGVLRAAQRLLTDAALPAPAPDALPLAPGRFRQLARPILPDPAAQPIDYLAEALSLPRWLAERWFHRLGWDEALRLGFWFAAPAPLWLRVNRLRHHRDAFLAELAAAGFDAEPAPELPQAVRLREPAPIRSLPGYAQGAFSVQDLSAQRVAHALDPKPGMAILDLCAAPGGKTTHLAERMNNQGRILACDISAPRLMTLRSLARRLGISIITTRALTPGRESLPPRELFDAALVDVPCSNTGVLGRRPEARWRIQPHDLENLPRVQTRLLTLACHHVRPGGCVLYSTCSIEPEENAAVVRRVLEARPNWRLEAEEVSAPGQPADGGYWARVRRAR